MPTTTPGPESGIEHDDLLECLDELPAEQRAVVVERHYVQPESRWEDISRSLGLTDADAARRLYTRARVGLIRCWQRRRGGR